MNQNKLLKGLRLFTLIHLILTACGAKTAMPEVIKTDAPPITSNGYACPAPEFDVEVQSTEMNLLVWTDYVSSEMIECFELVYDVKINRDGYSRDDGLYDRISGGGAMYDLILPTDYMIGRLTGLGLLQEIDHAQLPVLKNFNPNYLDFEFDPGNRYTLPYLIGTNIIVVNTAAVQTIPQAWADLWNPQYAGRIVLLDDSRAVIGMTLLALGYDPNTTDPALLEEAKLKLAVLIPAIKIFDSDSPKTALLAQEVALGMTWTGEAFLAHQKNPQIEYIFPAEGAILWQDNWAIPKNAPHVDAAYAWLNYINQGNVFWMTLRDVPYTNPNQAALEFAKGNQMQVKGSDGMVTTLSRLYDAYIQSPISNVSLTHIRTGHRLGDVGAAVSIYDAIWNEIRNGN